MNPNEILLRLRGLASLRLATVLVAVVFLEVLAGTVVQCSEGAWAARRLVFDNWLGGVPFVGTLAVVEILAIMAVRFEWNPRRGALLAVHAGLVAILLSGLLGLVLARTSMVDLRTGERASEGGVSGSWQLVLSRGRGADPIVRSLDGVAEGTRIGFGAAGGAVVAGFAGNGVLGIDQSPIPVPRSDDPAMRSPAIALDFAPAGGAALRLALDGRRPVFEIGDGSTFTLRRVPHPLSFVIELVGLRRELHGGSVEARVRIAERGGAWRDATIHLDRPLRIGAFAVYLSSWKSEGRSGRERVVLSVVEDHLGGLPLWASLLVAGGVVAHLLVRLRRPSGAVVAVFLLVCAATARADVAVPPAPPSLKSLPLRFGEEATSFDVFARRVLLQLSGGGAPNGLDASDWLAAVLLDPDRVRDLPLFRVENPDLRDALGLADGRDLLPWSALDTSLPILDALASDAEGKSLAKRSAFDREAMRLADAWVRYHGLANAFAFMRSSSVAPWPDGRPPAERYFDLVLGSERHLGRVDSLSRLPPQSMTESDRMFLAWIGATFDGIGRWKASEFPVFPVRGKDCPWESPAAVIARDGLADPSFLAFATGWDSLRASWLRGDRNAAETASRTLRDSVVARAGPSLRTSALGVGSFLDRSRPFSMSSSCFLASVLVALVGFRARRRWIRVAGTALAFAGVGLLLGGLALRGMVALRFPADTLHGLILLAAALTVSVLLALARLRRWEAGTLPAAFAGLVLLLLAGAFGFEGDSAPVFDAMLHSRFLLAARGLLLASGCGCVVAAGIAAHVHLLHLRSERPDQGNVAWGLTLAGFVLCALGIVSGGIWADRFLGRFWGWETPENGMLLVASWTATLLHARKAGMLGTRGFSIGAVFGITVVFFAGLLSGNLDPAALPVATSVVALHFLGELAFLAWLLLSRRVRLFLRGFRLWRILERRARNPRLRRHDG